MAEIFFHLLHVDGIYYSRADDPERGQGEKAQVEHSHLVEDCDDERRHPAENRRREEVESRHVTLVPSRDERRESPVETGEVPAVDHPNERGKAPADERACGGKDEKNHEDDEGHDCHDEARLDRRPARHELVEGRAEHHGDHHHGEVRPDPCREAVVVEDEDGRRGKGARGGLDEDLADEEPRREGEVPAELSVDLPKVQEALEEQRPPGGHRPVRLARLVCTTEKRVSARLQSGRGLMSAAGALQQRLVPCIGANPNKCHENRYETHKA